jgi:hypothetical protein
MGDEMFLSIKERLTLLGMLPQQGTMQAMKSLRILKEALAFDQEESDRLQVRQDGDMIYWDQEKEEPKSVKIGSVELSLIMDKIKELDDNGEITDMHVELFDRLGGNTD